MKHYGPYELLHRVLSSKKEVLAGISKTLQNAFTMLILFPLPCPYFPSSNYCNRMLMFDTKNANENY